MSKIVAISGGFDPLHDQHYQHIEEALALGDELLIILTRDDQLRGKKGKNAPWIPYRDRKYMLDLLLQGKGTPYRIVPNVDLDALKSARKKVIEALQAGIMQSFEMNGVELIHGRARVNAPHEVEITGDDGTINLKTAEMIGLYIPDEVLLQADTIIR